MITKINHVGIVANSIDNALKLYTEVLGLSVKDIEVVEDFKTRITILPVGESKIELLESTDPEGPIAKHIEEFGEGLHHIALEVVDIEDALKKLSEHGIPLIDAN